MIATFDPHKALTTTEYGAAWCANRAEENAPVGWTMYSDENGLHESWYKSAKPFIAKVVSAKGLKVVLCISRAKPNFDQYKYEHKIVLDREYLLDASIYLHVDDSIDITAEVMSLMWADVKSRM